MIKNNALTLLEHSKAKIELYETYLSIYLNIMERAGFIKKIHLYDLMCGEGIYEDNSKGSPVVALETIKNHFFSNGKKCLPIDVWYNDSEHSEIEGGKYKIERVEEACKKIFKPNNVLIKYTKDPYKNIVNEICQKLKNLRQEKALLFIDPHGYKDIKPKDIKELLSGNSEILLFLPVSFMYRFAQKALSDPSFSGGEPLYMFLTELYENKTPKFKSSYDFINQIKNQFQIFLKDKSILVDTFPIERDDQNVYCLFFFTSHIRGFEKMLESKWKVDEQSGKGFSKDKSISLFTESQLRNYPGKIKEFLKDNNRTNADLYLFGLQQGFLPKHTLEVLKDKERGFDFDVELIKGKKPRKNTYYIPYDNHANQEQIIKFKLIENV